MEENMKKGLLILLPGIRYSTDCPLLYYTRVAYSYAGYDVIPVDDYGVKDTDDLDAFADKATKNLVKRLTDVVFEDYEHVIFAEKSVGTVIGMMLEDVLKIDNITHILYTPLEAIYTYLTPARSIAGVACGTDDKHIEIKALRAACKKLELPLVEIKNTGHRLEGGKDVTKDISAVAQVIATIGDPAAAEKLWKKQADEKAAAEKKAAEEKAAAEKAAKEKAAKEATEKEAAEKKAAREAAKKAGKIIAAEAKNVRKLKPGTKGSDKLIEEMMEIWLQSNVAEQSFIPKKYWSKNYKEVLRVMSIASVYIYEEDGQILGFAGSMEEAMVAITVKDDERGRGIGTLLLDKLKDEMGILEASVYTKNKNAMKFFQKNDFKAKDIQIESSTGEEIVLLNW